jgi:pyridoxamine 5'-phosphate oxidase
MTGLPPPRLETLAEVHAAVWRELARAPLDRHHEWRTPTLATVRDGLPDARTVVLREVDTSAGLLRVFSDSRAGKVAQLDAQPQAVLVMWSRRLSWQVRLRVAVTVHTDGLAATSRWVRLSQSPAARDYLSPQTPGQPLDEALAPSAHPDRGTPAVDRGHFAVLEAVVQHIDWLELHPDGHRRAALGGLHSVADARWLTP